MAERPALGSHRDRSAPGRSTAVLDWATGRTRHYHCSQRRVSTWTAKDWPQYCWSCWRRRLVRSIPVWTTQRTSAMVSISTPWI